MFNDTGLDKDFLAQEGVLGAGQDNIQQETEAPQAVSETQVQQVVAEEPVVEQVQSEPVAQAEAQIEIVKEPEVDRTKLLEEISGGRFKSQEDIDRLYQENEALKQKLENDSYRTDAARKFDNWVESGNDPELFHIIQSLPVDNLNDEEALKARYRIERPELSAEDVDLLIADKYKQTDEYTDNQRRVGTINQSEDAREARRFLSDLKAKTDVTDVTNVREASRQQEVQRVEAWTKDIPNHVNSFDKITVAAGDKDNYNYFPSVDQKKVLQQELEKIFRNAPIPYNEESKAAVNQIVEDTFFRLYKNEITKAVAVAAKSKANEQIAKEIHNPSGARGESLPSKKPTGQTEDDIAAKFAAANGVRW
jgi:hypothetical protein